MEVIGRVPLVLLTAAQPGGFFHNLFDTIRLWFIK